MSAVIQDPAAGDALRRAEQAAADAERARVEADRIRAERATARRS